MKQNTKEKFKTSIGGQALIEGIMMRGPELDAIAIRKEDGIEVETTPRKIRSTKSVLSYPPLRGIVNFFDTLKVGYRAIMRSADLSGLSEEEEPSKFDQWLERKLGSERGQKIVIGIATVLAVLFSVGLFFLLPMIVSSFFDTWITNPLLLNLVEGVVRIVIFVLYMFLTSRLKEMKRVFGYHGAEHKTIRCYEAGLELTVENVRPQTRKHPRCGTSFLLVVMIVSILVFSVVSSLLLAIFPGLALIRGSFWYRVIMILCKLLILPLVVSISYEFNRWAGRHDNWFTRILTAPGMWFQNFTTFEPDDSMIEVAIASLKAVLPQQEGSDRW